MTTITKQDNSPLGALRSPLALTPALLALALALPGGEAWGANCTYTNGRVTCGQGANPGGINTVAVGDSSSAGGNYTTAVGSGSIASVTDTTAVGAGANAGAEHATAVGQATASAGKSIAVGQAQASGEGSMAIGDGAIASGDNAMAFGTGALANAQGAVAFGDGARALAAGSVAFGGRGAGLEAARATHKGGIALGAGSVDRQSGQDAGVSGYDILRRGASSDTGTTWRSNAAAHAVGDVASGVTRQVTGVAAGVEPTDGVNVAQLKRAREAIDNIHYFVSANGKRAAVYGDDTVHFEGDGNIHVDLNGQTVSINLDPNLRLESITINNGGPRMDKGGINMANSPITNLADGVAPHDAVNKGQLDDVDDNLRAGVATAVAQANVPQAVNPGANMLGMGVGQFRDQTALALGWSARSDNGRWVWRTDLGVNSDEVVLNNTIGYEF